MYFSPLRIVLLIVVTAASAAVSAFENQRDPIRIAVVGPADPDHFATAAARELERAVSQKGIRLAIEPAPLTGSPEQTWDLMIMPVRSLATQVPALEILELPFFYPSLAAVHANLDGALGERLTAEAGDRGWRIVTFWDEGMHIISGLKRFDRVRNLKAREFLITRPDPVAERQFQYWKADARRIRPENRQAVLRECLIANRAATLQEVMREQLYRVHLTMSITNHRYEGWLVIAPLARWNELGPQTQRELEATLAEISAWQRHDIAQREAAALAELRRHGMTIHEVDAAERQAFRVVLPDWAELLSDELSAQQKRELVDLASVGTAAFVATAGSAGPHPGDDTPPGTQDH